MIGIMFLIMILMIFAGVPVAFSILGSGIFFLLQTGMKPLTLVCQRAVTGLDCRAYGLRPCHGGGYRQYYDSIPCEKWISD